MTRTDFDALVNDLERRFSGRPRMLSCRTAIVVAVGYLGFLLWLSLIASFGLLAFVGALWAPIEFAPFLILGGACILGVAVWQTVEVLWLPRDDDQWLSLRSSDAPALFDLLARLRRELRTPRIHLVAITVEMNAGIQQRSLLGILGWSRNILYLGLPLMDMLTPEEFESVLAHEFAHISARHGRFAAWIYRLRGTWQRLLARLQEPPKSTLSRLLRQGLGRFVEWYWPRFHAYFFVQSRVHEYVADRCAADWSGAGTTSAALWKIGLYAQRVEQRFWPHMTQRVNREAEPPTDLSRYMRGFLAQPAEAADAARWVQQLASTVTDNSDTHPSLTDRFAAFGGSLTNCRASGFPLPPQRSAAEQFFAPQLDRIREEADRRWCHKMASAWRIQHAKAASLQHRLDQLGLVAAPPNVDAELLWEKTLARLELDGSQAAEPLLRQVLALRPAHAGANLALGRHLLQSGQTEGELFLRRIFDEPENELIPEVCQVLAQHFQLTGQAEQLRNVYAQLGRFQKAQAESQRERNTVTASDRFLPPELPDSDCATLRGIFTAEPDLAGAYLVRKELRHFTHQPLYVLCVHSQPGFLGRSNSASDTALVARLIPQVRLPGRVLIVAPQGGFRALARKIMSMPEALFYSQ